ncbi:MAG: DUF2029 domain-containing protein [Anaerolineae bacterium]|nr:DUF2029 domain-containing protein [Anaerolineae bacterium]
MFSFGSKRLNQFLLILLLFLNARVLMLLVLPADNLTLYGDYPYYFDLGRLFGELGYWPFIHYWSEYPPLFPSFNLAIYELSGGIFKNYVVWLGLFLLLFEAGILVLLYLLSNNGRDADAGPVGWVYALLYVPLFIWLRHYDPLAVFFFLLALFTLLRGRSWWLTGLIIGVGTMIKFFPVLLLIPIWWLRGWQTALKSGLVILLVIIIIFGPLLLLSPDYTLASLLAQSSKSSWQTVWALLDGNVDNTGSFGPLEDHFDLAKATETLYHPSRLSPWLTLLSFGLLGIFILTRPLVRNKKNSLIITSLVLLIFFCGPKAGVPSGSFIFCPCSC